MHECSSRCTQAITENKPENKYNGEQIEAVSTTTATAGSVYVLKKETISNSHASFFLLKLLHPWSKCKWKKPQAAGAADVDSV